MSYEGGFIKVLKCRWEPSMAENVGNSDKRQGLQSTGHWNMVNIKR